MKNLSKFVYSTLLVVSVFTACKKESKGTTSAETPVNVVQVQNALIVEPTATWCGPCGSYGRPATELAVTGNPNAIPMYAHLKAPASDLGCQLGQDLAVLYGAANADGSYYSIPQIAVGNQVTGAYTDLDYTANVLKGWIYDITSNVSKANTSISASISGNTLNVKTNTKFFANGDDSFTYKIAVYLAEDGITNRQFMAASGAYETITHNHVGRVCLSASSYGDDLLAGKPTSGLVVSREYSKILNTAWVKDNLSVIAVIWKRKNGGDLTFVNVDKIDL